MTIARCELERDRLYPLLTPEQRDFYRQAALEIGEREAAPYRTESMLDLAGKLGVTVENYDGGNVIAGSEVYAEYHAVTRNIRLHRAGIAQLVKRLSRTIPEGIAWSTARDLLIAHELFHHLEATRFGPIHRRLPTISVPIYGRWWSVQRPVLRTREIAAHSFAHTALGMSELANRYLT